MLMPEHTAQALDYLHATRLEVCLLINFGRSKVEIKRLLPYTDWKEKKIDFVFINPSLSSVFICG
jgi:hypothetical protein